MKKSKKNKRNKNKNKRNNESTINDIIQKDNNIKINKISLKFTDEELACKDISPEHCEELRKRTFSNDPKRIFLEVRTLEERYKYAIEKERVAIKSEIEKTKEKYGLKYKKALENKYKEINFYKTELNEEMKKNLEMLTSQEHVIISEIDMIYKIKSKLLIKKGMTILGITF